MTTGSTPPGWYRDPTGQAEARYWNGVAWTEAVNHGGQQSNVPIDASVAETPPAPGTQVQLPPPPSAPSSSGGGGGGAGGVIIAIVVGLLLIVAVVVATGDSSEAPTPGTDAPPATEAPPSSEGG